MLVYFFMALLIEACSVFGSDIWLSLEMLVTALF